MINIKERVRIKQMVLQELLEINELWVDIDMAQHLCTIMRPYKDAYFWTDEMLLKKIEKYRAELEDNQIDEERTDTAITGK